MSAGREHALSCGYIGDSNNGALVLHDGDDSIVLGMGIPTDQAVTLGIKLDKVLYEIHLAQVRYTL